MEATFNFVLTELLWYSDHKEFVDGFIDELKKKRISIEIEYLNEESFTTELFADLKILLDKTLIETQQKLKCIKAQDFEGAAAFRNAERELLSQLEKDGFNLYKLNHNEVALYHVEVDKKGRKLKFIVYTNSEEFVGLLKSLSEGKGI